jgi:hypothetical protein
MQSNACFHVLFQVRLFFRQLKMSPISDVFNAKLAKPTKKSDEILDELFSAIKVTVSVLPIYLGNHLHHSMLFVSGTFCLSTPSSSF